MYENDTVLFVGHSKKCKKCKVIYRKALSALWLYLSGKTKWSFNENFSAIIADIFTVDDLSLIHI